MYFSKASDMQAYHQLCSLHTLFNQRNVYSLLCKITAGILSPTHTPNHMTTGFTDSMGIFIRQLPLFLLQCIPLWSHILNWGGSCLSSQIGMNVLFVASSKGLMNGLFSSPHRRPVSREVQKWLHFPRDGYVVATISRSRHRKGFAMWCILSMAMNILSEKKIYIALQWFSIHMQPQCSHSRVKSLLGFWVTHPLKTIWSQSHND